MEGKKFVLVRFEANYADEFDIQGMQVYEKEKWEEIINDPSLEEEMEGGYSISFGSNEEVDFDSFDDFKESHSVTEISEAEYNFMRDKVCGKDGYGHWLIDNIL